MQLTPFPPRLRRLATLLLATLLLLAAGNLLVTQAKSAREERLAQSLQLLRGALRQHHEDAGHYPARLADLVAKRYLRQLPKDPFTDSHDTWQLVRAGNGGITNVFSSADGTGGNRMPYRHW